MTRLLDTLWRRDSVQATQGDPVRAQFLADFSRALARETRRDDPRTVFRAFAEACRPILADRWAATQRAGAARATRRVHYLSMEFLMGRAFDNAVAALDLEEPLRVALAEATLPSLEALAETERDAALGNGGLGRLAACFLDSMATLELSAMGYGLFYRYGMFAQRIEDGRQGEMPDDWHAATAPWEFAREEVAYPVSFGGHVAREPGGRAWIGAERVMARAVDMVVPGHGTQRVATLRLWKAEAARPIDFAAFCRGEHAASGAHLTAAESLNWVLYPDDSTAAGRALRLKQEYLLVSASIQDMVARHLAEGRTLDRFGRDNVVHLNDTHPALAPAELMRVLVDEHGLEWDAAWRITRESTSYTNHTLMPEALETWGVALMADCLPRHLEIIYEINQRFLDQARRQHGADEARVRRLSLIEEGPERRVRMAHLAIVASHQVNGVSALHSRLMVETIFADFAALDPGRFTNVTNGVTHRRWLARANPRLADLFDRTLGTEWRRDPRALKRLAAHAFDPALQRELAAIKLANKTRLAETIRASTGIAVDAAALFDVQAKRIHEYKRQLLNVLQVVARYQAIVADPAAHPVRRVVVFAGKAASAYRTAKLVIQLIHDVARVVNADPRVGDRLKVVFLPDYGVSLAERIIPAADLSEQISTAGTEASGTGNMKFALNGALTIGTWDGANIEMGEAMGRDNLFVFGLDTAGVTQTRALGYDPRLFAEQDRRLAAVLEAIGGGHFSPGEPGRYRGLVDALLQHDPYLLLADFASYLDAQAAVDRAYTDPAGWNAKVVANLAAMGGFSSDRTIAEYAQKIWRAEAVR